VQYALRTPDSSWIAFPTTRVEVDPSCTVHTEDEDQEQVAEAASVKENTFEHAKNDEDTPA
jgi:hypothetical protein